jgi:uncharacterized membrane protein (DUF373 family)
VAAAGRWGKHCTHVFIRVVRLCDYVQIDLLELTEPSKDLMKWLVLGATYFLLGLFLIGVVDLLLGLYDLVVTGDFTKPIEVVSLLDTVLLLLIIVEVHRTLLAYVREEPVIRIVVGAAIVSIAREVISFQADQFDSGQETLAAAGALGVLLLTLIVAYYFVCRIEPADAGLN